MNNFFDRFGGIMNFKNQFAQFQQNLSSQGINPQQKVQELLNSGRWLIKSPVRTIKEIIHGR